MSTEFDDLSTKCKYYEALGLTNYLKGLPVFIRLDGRAFHTYTNGLKRPFDPRISHCMLETTKALIKNFHAKIGYTQSDEITLMLYEDPEHSSSCLPFDGKVQKLVSTSAGLASAKFATEAYENIPEKRHLTPHFDARIWCCSTEEAVNVFTWRQWDARKNSITMAASSVYSHKELLNKDSNTKRAMLLEKGIDWKNYPDFFREGVFLKRKVVERDLTEEELAKIPEKFRPEGKVLRAEILPVKETLTWELLKS